MSSCAAGKARHDTLKWGAVRPNGRLGGNRTATAVEELLEANRGGLRWRAGIEGISGLAALALEMVQNPIHHPWLSNKGDNLHQFSPVVPRPRARILFPRTFPIRQQRHCWRFPLSATKIGLSKGRS